VTRRSALREAVTATAVASPAPLALPYDRGPGSLRTVIVTTADAAHRAALGMRVCSRCRAALVEDTQYRVVAQPVWMPEWKCNAWEVAVICEPCGDAVWAVLGPSAGAEGGGG